MDPSTAAVLHHRQKEAIEARFQRYFGQVCVARASGKSWLRQRIRAVVGSPGHVLVNCSLRSPIEGAEATLDLIALASDLRWVVDHHHLRASAMEHCVDRLEIDISDKVVETMMAIRDQSDCMRVVADLAPAVRECIARLPMCQASSSLSLSAPGGAVEALAGREIVPLELRRADRGDGAHALRSRSIRFVLTGYVSGGPTPPSPSVERGRVGEGRCPGCQCVTLCRDIMGIQA